MNNITRCACVALAACAAAASTLAGTQVFRLNNHPDGNAAPAPYGLRLDRLFRGMDDAGGGTTTFSFDTAEGVFMRVTEEAGEISINIKGQVFGGEKDGSDYDFGKGLYDLDFSFSMNVEAQGTGWVVTENNPDNNKGTLTAAGDNDGVDEGTSFNFYDMSAASFLFLQDEHRLGGHPEAGQDPAYWVGRGWVTYRHSGRNSRGTQDWLFIGTQVIPMPTAAAFGLLGIAGVASRRRRAL